MTFIVVAASLLLAQPAKADPSTATIELTPREGGEIRFACGMDMISGVLVVD